MRWWILSWSQICWVSLISISLPCKQPATIPTSGHVTWLSVHQEEGGGLLPGEAPPTRTCPSRWRWWWGKLGAKQRGLSAPGSPGPGSGWRCCWGCAAPGGAGGAGAGARRPAPTAPTARGCWTPAAWTGGRCWRCRARTWAAAGGRRRSSSGRPGRTPPPRPTARRCCRSRPTRTAFLPARPRCRPRAPAWGGGHRARGERRYSFSKKLLPIGSRLVRVVIQE